MNLDETAQRAGPRFLCDLCGQPLPPEGATSLSYDYQGRTAAFRACSTCLTARTLLPELFGARADPPSARR